MPLRFLLTTLVLLCLFFAKASFSQSAGPQVIRGPYLQQVTPHSIVIRWRTDSATTSRVTFGTGLNYDNSVSKPGVTTEHRVEVSGLQPSTRYFYAIGDDANILQGDSANFFHTAPIHGSVSPVRIWTTGDFGVGSTAQAAVRDAYMNYSPEATNLWIWLGDNAYYSGTDNQYQEFVFDMYPHQLKQFPLYPAPGNHDYGQVGYLTDTALTTSFPYFSIFTVPEAGEAGGVPSGTPKYYSYNYANIHFISLDSYGAQNHPGSAMYNWLTRDLEANTQRWTIVYFHHPPYSKGSHDSDREIELIDMRTHIVPLLETFKVDLVLSGHSHSNERSYLIRGHYGTSGSFESSMLADAGTGHFVKKAPYNGTIYAVCGTSGQPAGGHQGDAPMPCMYFNDFSTNCSMVIDVLGDELHARYLAASGAVIDSFSMVKSGPLSPLTDGDASCEISYHAGSNHIFLSMLLTREEPVQAGLLNMAGEWIMPFPLSGDSLPAGYHIKSISTDRVAGARGVYLVRVQIGDHVFVKKIFMNHK